LHAFLCWLLDFFFPHYCLADALTTANARISSLEAELSIAQKAFDVATTAKVSVEKSNKSALTKAKKAEKALADAKKEHLQREQAVAEWLNTMSAAAGDIYYIFLLLLLPLFYLLSFTHRYFPLLLLSAPLVLQNTPRCLCRLCHQTMILSWLRLAYLRRTGYLSRKSSS
jgi:hypothetical protein